MYVEGVLANKGVAIKDGLGLYRTVQEKLAVILLCEDKAKTEHWLLQNGIKKIDNIVDRNNLRKNQFATWEEIEFNKNIFMKPKLLAKNIKQFLKILQSDSIGQLPMVKFLWQIKLYAIC